MSVDLHLSLDSYVITRNTGSLFDLLADVGGLSLFLKLLFGAIALPLSKMRLDALINNRLYHLPSDF